MQRCMPGVTAPQDCLEGARCIQPPSGTVARLVAVKMGARDGNTSALCDSLPQGQRGGDVASPPCARKQAEDVRSLDRIQRLYYADF